MVSSGSKLKRKLPISKQELPEIEHLGNLGTVNDDSDEPDENLLGEVNEDDSSDEEFNSDFEESDEENQLNISDKEDSDSDVSKSDSDLPNEEDSEEEENEDDDVEEGEEDDDDDVDDEGEKESDDDDNEEVIEDKPEFQKNNIKNQKTNIKSNVSNTVDIEKQDSNLRKSPKIKTVDKKLNGSTVKTNTSKDIKNHKQKKPVTTQDGSIAEKNVVRTEDEYADGDTSDEEDIRNTIGNVPVNWYDEYKHIGYDWEGKQILKPDHGDQVDYFLRKMEDPNFWRTVRDHQTGQDVVLADSDVDLIKRLEDQKIPDEAFDEYAPWIEWFSSEVMETPLRKIPDSKKSFLPSLHEKRIVSKMVYALKMGWIKPKKVLDKERRQKSKAGPQFYMLWEGDDVAEEMRRLRNHIPAPKRQLPGHAESYNPPSEYLFNEKELAKFEESKRSLGNQKLHFIPQKYSSLRQVPAYDRFIIERFIRCLDLYLCPRAIKMKLLIEPEDLLPKLPNPKDLQPFPTVQSLVFTGHSDMVRTISIDPLGQYLVSGSDDKTVKFWEISTGRCLKTITLDGVIRCVRWCPSSSLSLVAVAADNKCFIINPGLGDALITSKTDEILKEPPPELELSSERVKVAVQWQWQKDNEDWPEGVLIIINHFKEVKQIAWHGRGDYFATVMPEGANRSVMIHQLSKGKSQLPFTKSKGLVQCVIFHPVRPYFFVATQRNIRIYDLVKQEMVKKLVSSSRWISNIAIHPGGDNLLISSYDPKVAWFDLDLSTKPYKVLKLHKTAVRSVAYHKRYPLFASVSDDCNLIISHGMVYNDLMQNALIVPLKKLSFHKSVDDFGIFDVMFHHFQPWVFTCGADKTIRLYS